MAARRRDGRAPSIALDCGQKVGKVLDRAHQVQVGGSRYQLQLGQVLPKKGVVLGNHHPDRHAGKTYLAGEPPSRHAGDGVAGRRM